MFQGFSQDLMMVIGNLMQWKFRMPGVFKKMLRNMTEKAVHDILTKVDGRMMAYVRLAETFVSISMRWAILKVG